MKCVSCKTQDCYNGKDCTGLRDEIVGLYTDEDRRSLKVSASIEAKHYMKKTRVEELIMYANEMGYKKLGLAFCVGLTNEAKTLAKILKKDFEVHSVCCKVCGIDKDKFELDKLHPDREVDSMCNPVGQAKFLNKENTDLNIILGLCIGHDILFTKYSEAPVTTLAVKDRVLAHNPLGAIYSNYYLEKIFFNSSNEVEKSI